MTDAEDRFIRNLQDSDRTPELQEAIWRYREGSCSRHDLMADPAFNAAMSQGLRASRRRLAAEGMTAERMAELVRGVMEAESQTFEGRARLDPLREAMDRDADPDDRSPMSDLDG